MDNFVAFFKNVYLLIRDYYRQRKKIYVSVCERERGQVSVREGEFICPASHSPQDLNSQAVARPRCNQESGTRTESGFRDPTTWARVLLPLWAHQQEADQEWSSHGPQQPFN